jgi:chromosomal replication initiator protein
MLDYVTDIPLPGRILSPPDAPFNGHTTREPLPAFVAGPENRLVAGAIGALMRSTSRATDAPRTNRFAPTVLVLFGPSGTGKTHLAQGLVRHWQAEIGEENATYTTAADFRHRLNDAIKRQAELEFRTEFRGRQLLAIDDLQHLPGDDHVLQILRYTLDDYEDRGGTVVVTSTQPMNELPNLPPDLRSRLASGLALQLAPPGDAARVRIIRHAAHALGRPLSDEAADRLAHGLEGTANNLHSAVFELCSSANSDRTSDVSRAEQWLAARAGRQPTLREITAVVARHQNMPQSQLKSSSRRQSIVFARGLVAYLARELAAASYDQIGRALGGRDHTTILHSYRKIARQRERDPQTQQLLEHLRRILLCR